MPRQYRPRRFLVALFVLAMALLNYPILALFDRPIYLFGIPLLVAYVYAVWTTIVALAYVMSRRITFSEPADDQT